MTQNLFPAYPCEEVLKRVARMWTIGEDDLFPLPKFVVRCPVCGSTDIQARNWQFAYRDAGGCRYRCNVSFKCTVCSNVWTHGVVIPERMFRKHVRDNPHRTRLYHWREVRKILEEVKQDGHGGRH